MWFERLVERYSTKYYSFYNVPPFLYVTGKLTRTLKMATYITPQAMEYLRQDNDSYGEKSVFGQGVLNIPQFLTEMDEHMQVCFLAEYKRSCEQSGKGKKVDGLKLAKRMLQRRVFRYYISSLGILWFLISQACVRHIQVLKSQCAISENSKKVFAELVNSARQGDFDDPWEKKNTPTSSGKSTVCEVSQMIFFMKVICINAVCIASSTRWWNLWRFISSKNLFCLRSVPSQVVRRRSIKWRLRAWGNRFFSMSK